MSKKEPTAKQLAARKKFGEQARARAAARKQSTEQPTEAPAPQAEPVTLSLKSGLIS
jgi:hypothetical protein